MENAQGNHHLDGKCELSLSDGNGSDIFLLTVLHAHCGM